MNRAQALQTLGVSASCSKEEYRLAYKRLALLVHPDKNPQNVQACGELMRRLNEAREVLEATETVRRDPVSGQVSPQPDLSSSSHGAALHLMQYLGSLSKRHPEKQLSRALVAQVQSTMPQVPRITEFVAGVLRIVDDHVQKLHRSHRSISWHASGLKTLSEGGYDTTCNGLRIIDYGNWEYTSVLGALCLIQPSLHSLLNRLQVTWPSLDMWFEPKSDHQYEMLGDIMEIVMAGLRGDAFFVELEASDRTTLPRLFNGFCQLCRLVHLLNGHFESGTKKWDRHSPLRRLHVEPFLSRWSEGPRERSQLLAALWRWSLQTP